MRQVNCDYCGKPANLIDSKLVYRRSYGQLWYCPYCKAWVGCERGTDKPLGRLANAELRKNKRIAHNVFDRIWREEKDMTRKTAYEWLAREMGLTLDETHIGMFDNDKCLQVIQICRKRLEERFHVKEAQTR